MLKSFIEAAGAQTVLLLQTFYWTFESLRNGKFSFKNLINQMSIIGVDSFLMVAISGFSLGAVLVVQIGFQFANMGAQGYVGGVVALAMTREIAPIMTAIVVAGRIGSSMAAEIGTMKITEQIDALETMATNPVDYLVVPRFWACTSMLFLLTVVSNAFGMVGGSITAIYQIGLTFESFKDSILYLLKIHDLMGGLFNVHEAERLVLRADIRSHHADERDHRRFRHGADGGGNRLLRRQFCGCGECGR